MFNTSIFSRHLHFTVHLQCNPLFCFHRICKSVALSIRHELQSSLQFARARCKYSSCPTLRTSVNTCFSPSFALKSVHLLFSTAQINHTHTQLLSTQLHARTRMYAHIRAHARDIYADAASNDFTLPSSNRAALRLSFSIIVPPACPTTPTVRQNPLSDPKV